MGHSFEIPEYTSEVSGLGTLRILEAMRFLKLKKCKFYQASTSELFGETFEKNSFTEDSLMVPKSPYGVSKLYSFWITKVYREAYGFHASNGILFNHESPRRGETFVTRKITMFFAKLVCGINDILYIGNLDAKRDWGHAKDYVEIQWKILQQKKPDDFVIATGKAISVREFINECCKYLKLKIIWKGNGLKEKAYLDLGRKKKLIIRVDSKYYRPLEINFLRGNPKKALKHLKYKLKYNLKDLVKDMLDSDIKLEKKIIKMKKSSRIFLAGHNGLVGSYLFKLLKNNGYKNIITVEKKQLNLRDFNKVEKFFRKKKKLIT